MLPQLSAAVRVFLCTRPTDLRKGFDGLSGLVQECFSQDLLTGHLFLFLRPTPWHGALRPRSVPRGLRSSMGTRKWTPK